MTPSCGMARSIGFEFMDTHSEIGICGPKVLNRDEIRWE
jgi:hypothetical protein